MITVPTGGGDPVLARVVRCGVTESVHRGAMVLIGRDGDDVLARGAVDETMLPRSTLKPLQAAAMLRAGLDLSGELLALASASHAGEPAHREGVLRILAGAGLDETALDNTAALPLDPTAACTEGAPSRLAQNCSGKHAAMVATCVAAGWPVTGYREPGHPLQRSIRATVAELTGVVPDPVLVDGCGAPLFSCTLRGLARAFARIATADPAQPEGQVAAAIRAHPWWLGGNTRSVTGLLRAVPGLVAKDGAEGVFAAALPDGRALAVKIADGAPRPVPAVVVSALARLEVSPRDHSALGAIGRVDVLGHGEPVGAVEPVLED